MALASAKAAEPTALEMAQALREKMISEHSDRGPTVHQDQAIKKLDALIVLLAGHEGLLEGSPVKKGVVEVARVRTTPRN